MQGQGMKISDLRREMMSTSEHMLLLESNRKWADINDVMQRVFWLQNECSTLVAHSEHIARQTMEQVIQKLPTSTTQPRKHYGLN